MQTFIFSQRESRRRLLRPGTVLLLAILVPATAITESQAIAGKRKQGGSRTTYRGMFGVRRGYAETDGSSTTYRRAPWGTWVEARRNGDQTDYYRPGLFGPVQVGQGTTNNGVTTYTQPGLFGKQRVVGSAEQTSDGVVYRDAWGRRVGSASSTSDGTTYRNRRGKVWYRSSGAPSQPEQDGFIEIYRRQQRWLLLD